MPSDAWARIGTLTLNPAFDLTIPLRLLQRGEVNRAASSELRPAGKGVNVSVMLAVLGEPSIASGLLGAEDMGAFEHFLQPKGIICRFLPAPGRCRINVKLVEAETGTVTDINPPGPPVAEDALPQLVGYLDQSPELMVLSGSLPPGLPSTAWAEIAGHLASKGRRVILDTSGPALELAVKASLPFLMKPNRSELAFLLGRELEGREALLAGALELQGRGVANVVVSDGADGALFVLGQSKFWVRPPVVDLTTTVGAGDAMVAGLAAAFARGLAPEQAARLATGCAAAAVSRPSSGLPTMAEVTRLAAAADVTPL